MTQKEALQSLAALEKTGKYIKYHSGIIQREIPTQFGGNTTGLEYGVNIDGTGIPGYPFGEPKIIWDITQIKYYLLF